MNIKNIYDAVIFISAAVTLRDAILDAIAKKANLSCADLRSADLRYANLSYADLRYADLRSANLSYADLRSADLSCADLRSANLNCADLSSADLRYVDLRSANLSSANLRETKNAELALARIQFIPTEGQFIGWKKCQGEFIVKLRIPAKAKRSHGAERKCRCSEAVPVLIVDADGKNVKTAKSLHDSEFIYTVGKTAKPDGFDEDRWNVCGQGIHFYLTREEAEAHV